MRITRSLAGLALALFAGVLLAQLPQQPAGYHSVMCVKVKPDKGAEYHKWWEDEGKKYMQSMVDSGAVQTYYRLRTVVPSGSSAECDYVLISLYPGAPPEPTDFTQLAAVVKRAGLTVTPEQFVQHREAVRTLVSYGMFQNVLSLGAIARGDYLSVSYMKAANLNDWITMERTVWQPVANALIKDGIQKGWSVNLQVMPNGNDLPYQGVTVDVYPTWAAVFKAQLDPDFDARLKKVYPNEDIDAKMEKAMKTRTQSVVRLFQVEDMITSAK